MHAFLVLSCFNQLDALLYRPATQEGTPHIVHNDDDDDSHPDDHSLDHHHHRHGLSLRDFCSFPTNNRPLPSLLPSFLPFVPPYNVHVEAIPEYAPLSIDQQRTMDKWYHPNRKSAPLSFLSMKTAVLVTMTMMMIGRALHLHCPYDGGADDADGAFSSWSFRLWFVRSFVCLLAGW